MPPKKRNPLTAKERQQRWRDKQKCDSDSHSKYLENERERYRGRKEAGTRKGIDDLTQREKREQRRKWRSEQKEHRKRVKAAVQLVTPPVSPDPDVRGRVKQRSVNSVVGRKRVRRDRAKAYRTVEKLTVRLAMAERSRRRVQKRYERAQKHIQSSLPDTPRSKAKRLMRNGDLGKIRKHLTVSFSLMDNIRIKYKELGTQKEMQLVRSVFSHSFLNKYRLSRHTESGIGISRRTLKAAAGDRKRRRDRHSDKTKKTISDFLLRDDNSKMCPGKKDTITRLKDKKQKRHLSDTMLNLHQKFLFENPLMRISYGLFLANRPFWVMTPSAADRETCACRTHANLELMAERLFHLKVIKERNPEKLLDAITCSTDCCECMYRECAECRDALVPFEPYEQADSTHWYEFRVVDHEYKNKSTGKIEKTKKTEKVRMEDTVSNLCDRFEEQLTRKLCRHVFNIRHQYRQLRDKRLGLATNEMMLHIDFSENYGLKYHKEIQNCHFGASNAQVTLHTGMLYRQLDSVGFASVSESRRHDPSAIWAHLQPVFEKVARENPEIDTVYFVSDGPTTQYRCKSNFYMLAHKPFEWGMKHVNWSFLEAGHGKGAADGIGGVLKRTADRIVAQGADLPNAEAVFECLSRNTNVCLFYVTDTDVSRMDEYLNMVILRPIPGTMAFHQLISLEKGHVYCRRLSCFCETRTCCACFKPVKHQFPSGRVTYTTAQVHVSARTTPDTRGTSSEESDPARPDLLNPASTLVTESSEVAVVIPDDVTVNALPVESEHDSPRASINAEPSPPSEDQSTTNPVPTSPSFQPVYVYDEDLVGWYCVVNYDGKGYPGLIEDADEESIRIDSMHRVGRKNNIFFWLTKKDTEVWYAYTDVITLIPQPTEIDNGHFAVDPSIWSKVVEQLDEWVR